MGRQTYETIHKRYDIIRKLAHDNLVQREKDVYAKIPKIEDIVRQMGLLGIEYNKKILAGGSSSKDILLKLKNKSNALKEEKRKLLVENNYPPDYLDIKYHCSLCNDTGYISKSAHRESCFCFKQQLIDQIYKNSNIVLAEKDNFENFCGKYYSDEINYEKYGINISPRDNIYKIKERCERFIKNINNPNEMGLFFTGPAGVGKTFMCSCIAKEIINSERTVLYQTAPKLFDTINIARMNTHRENENDDISYKNILETDLLIIDDLGTESPSAARYAQLLTILNVRQMNGINRPCKTIISTNLDAKKINEYYTERVASRIIGCFEMFLFAGDDIRMIKKFQATL